jgi:LemA protein
MRNGVIVIGVILVILLIGVGNAINGYNSLIALDQAVRSQWGQVENAYQRRADLIPNLVETVKGVAGFEKSTYVAVAQARASVGRATLPPGRDITSDQGNFTKFAQAQDGLSSALSRLLVVSEQYPDLKANQNFLDLQAQLEGTENRITVERMRYNEAAQRFNTTRDSFPMVFIAGFFGSRFGEKTYFQAQPGAQTAPNVKF